MNQTQNNAKRKNVRGCASVHDDGAVARRCARIRARVRVIDYGTYITSRGACRHAFAKMPGGKKVSAR